MISYRDVINFADEVLSRKDPYNHHGKSVSSISLDIGMEIGLGSEEMRLLDYAARLHDVGKIFLDDLLLNYPRRLTNQERARIQSHVHMGAELLLELQYHPRIYSAVLAHHEHYDGSGYPNHLSGESIPLFARIICIADVWDSITQDRVYRNALEKSRALQEMNRCSNWFDPKLFTVFLKIIRDKI